VFAMVIAVMAAKKYLSYATPMYESTVKMRLADIGEGISNSNLFKNFDVFASANKIAAEIEVLKSSELISKTLDSLDFGAEIFRVGKIQTVELYKNSPIQVKLLNTEGSCYDRRFSLAIKSLSHFELFNKAGKLLLKGNLNTPYTLLDNKLIILLNKQVIDDKPEIKIIDNYEFEFLSREKLLEKINKGLDIVSSEKDVPVIRINFKSNVPDKACALVNKLAETYIYDYIESKYKAANVTVKFLEKQIDEAGKKLAQSENNIEDYRNENSIVNIKQETETDLRKISQLKIQQTNIKMNLEAIDELNKYVAFGKDKFLMLAPNFEAFTDLLSTEIIKSIKKLQADKRDLLLTYTATDERVLVVDEKINDLVTYLIESIKNTKTNLQIKYEQISKDISDAEKVFVTVPEKEKNLTILNRNFDLLQSSYNFLNEKKIEAEIAQSAKISFHKIITPAVRSEKPFSPNKPIIIILSSIMAMIGAIICIYVVHFLKAKVNDVVTIEKNTGIPIAILTPFDKKNTDKNFIKNVLQLELKGVLKKSSILTITSNDRDEGKGHNLINICKALINQHRTVLVVDAQGDLGALKTGTADENNVYKTQLTSLNYYPFDSTISLYYSNEKTRELINSQVGAYDFIIINNEFLKEESRALLMMDIADTNLFVIDARRTPLRLIHKLELLNHEYKFPNLSLVLNKSGYNPNVLVEFVSWVKQRIQKSKK
jgi:uncharacterized protein involved in exopolysaccharide biosynthesis